LKKSSFLNQKSLASFTLKKVKYFFLFFISAKVLVRAQRALRTLACRTEVEGLKRLERRAGLKNFSFPALRFCLTKARKLLCMSRYYVLLFLCAALPATRKFSLDFVGF